MTRRISRRMVLRGAGGAAVALPFLDAMLRPGRAHAAAPKRLVVFFSPNGTIRDSWTPTGGETAFTLSPILAPLEKHRADIVVIDGVDNVAATHGPGDDHQRGMGTMLTGTELVGQLGGGISVDQAIAAKIGGQTRFRSLELGVHSLGFVGLVWMYTAYADKGKPISAEPDPQKVWKRLFGGATADPAAAKAVNGERQSVIDAISENFASLSARVGPDDRARLDAHLTALRDVERRLTTAASGTGCASVAAPPAMDPMANQNFPAVGKLQVDLLVSALRCDLTRVATLQWDNSTGNTQFQWLGATRGHHDISHDPDSNADSVNKLVAINTWYAQQFAYLLDQLAATPDGDGRSLLDNTLVLWCNELSKGNIHSHPDMPYVLAGRAGGALRTGRYLRFPASPMVPHNNLLVSIMNMMDVPATTFGNPAYCTGPLAGL